MDYAHPTITSLNRVTGERNCCHPISACSDYYAIKWAYQPIFEAKTPEEEVPVLNRWIDEKADDPIYVTANRLFSVRRIPLRKPNRSATTR